MKPYIEELINDLKEAAEHANKSTKNRKKTDHDSLLKELCQPKEYHFGNPRKIEEIVGIPQAAFPPARLLSEEEKTALSKAMEELLNAWGFHPDFPPKLPMHLRYPKLREIWKSEQVYTGMGVNYIDVCEFEESSCPYPNYCNMCDLIREQEKLYNVLMQKRSDNKNSNRNG
ncbi:MAG: hypothetical protein ACLFM7_03340 [Bacteroidales bacterium]